LSSDVAIESVIRAWPETDLVGWRTSFFFTMSPKSRSNSA